MTKNLGWILGFFLMSLNGMSLEAHMLHQGLL